MHQIHIFLTQFDKFYNDEKGNITIRIKPKEAGGRKYRLTAFNANREAAPMTISEEELKDLVNDSKPWPAMEI